MSNCFNPRFQVQIPENYPDGDVPKVVFDNPVFHPCVDPVTNTLNVKQVGVKLNVDLNHMYTVHFYAGFSQMEEKRESYLAAASLHKEGVLQDRHH